MPSLSGFKPRSSDIFSFIVPRKSVYWDHVKHQASKVLAIIKDITPIRGSVELQMNMLVWWCIAFKLQKIMCKNIPKLSQWPKSMTLEIWCRKLWSESRTNLRDGAFLRDGSTCQTIFPASRWNFTGFSNGYFKIAKVFSSGYFVIAKSKD